MFSQFRRKYYGWLCYSFARYCGPHCAEFLTFLWCSYSEVFVIVSLTLFLPICLEQFARDNGFLLPDRTEPCSSAVSKLDPEAPPGRCVVKIGWVWIDSASFRWVLVSWNNLLSLITDISLYVFSASVLLQALTVISVGGIANHRVSFSSSACRCTYSYPKCSTISQDFAFNLRLGRCTGCHLFLTIVLHFSYLVPLCSVGHHR